MSCKRRTCTVYKRWTLEILDMFRLFSIDAQRVSRFVKASVMWSSGDSNALCLPHVLHAQSRVRVNNAVTIFVRIVCTCVCWFSLSLQRGLPIRGGSQLPLSTENSKTRRRPSRHVLFAHFSVHFHLGSALTWASAVPWMSLPLFSFHCWVCESILNTKNRKGCHWARHWIQMLFALCEIDWLAIWNIQS